MKEVPHEYGPSTVEHGETQCKWCRGTNRENALFSPNQSEERARHMHTEPNERREWLIRKGGYYYRPDRAGYTASVYEAGLFTEAEAKSEALMEPWHMTAVRLADVLSEMESATTLLDQMHELLHADQTGLAAGLESVLNVVKGFWWVTEGRGSYEWDDDRYREEMGNMLCAVRDEAQKALDRWRNGSRPCCELTRNCHKTEQPTETSRMRDALRIAIERYERLMRDCQKSDDMAGELETLKAALNGGATR